VILERKVFYPVMGKSLKTKKDCRQSFLYRFNAESYSGFISKVRQGGKERTTLTERMPFQHGVGVDLRCGWYG
jgi:hypothetical protein